MTWSIKILAWIIRKLQICPFRIPPLILINHEFICRPSFNRSIVCKSIRSIVNPCPVGVITSSYSSITFFNTLTITICFKTRPTSIPSSHFAFSLPTNHSTPPNILVRVFLCKYSIVVVWTCLETNSKLSTSSTSWFIIYHSNPSPTIFILSILRPKHSNQKKWYRQHI